MRVLLLKASVMTSKRMLVIPFVFIIIIILENVPRAAIHQMPFKYLKNTTYFMTFIKLIIYVACDRYSLVTTRFVCLVSTFTVLMILYHYQKKIKHFGI